MSYEQLKHQIDAAADLRVRLATEKVQAAQKALDAARTAAAKAKDKRETAEHKYDFAPAYRAAEFNLKRKLAYARRIEAEKESLVYIYRSDLYAAESALKRAPFTA